MKISETPSDEELIGMHENGTFLDGLKMALGMTKAEIRKAIKIIQETE